MIKKICYGKVIDCFEKREGEVVILYFKYLMNLPLGPKEFNDSIIIDKKNTNKYSNKLRSLVRIASQKGPNDPLYSEEDAINYIKNNIVGADMVYVKFYDYYGILRSHIVSKEEIQDAIS